MGSLLSLGVSPGAVPWGSPLFPRVSLVPRLCPVPRGSPLSPGLSPAAVPVPPERIQKFLGEQQLPLTLIGASYSGVSVNDCIASAKAAVGRVLGSLPES